MTAKALAQMDMETSWNIPTAFGLLQVELEVEYLPIIYILDAPDVQCMVYRVQCTVCFKHRAK